MECRKLSATKRYRLVSIDKSADLTVKELEAEVVAEEQALVEEVNAVAEKPSAEKEEAVEANEEKEAE